ncbi:hypothetical protein [Streptomyces rubiginosohelvolus]|uniref:hypothetical protein n=1 Tax=Streptomyces rubiginosohelvolus TaxID=67362 RepID=UPI0033EDAA00
MVRLEFSFDTACELTLKEKEKVKDALLNVAISQDISWSAGKCRDEGVWEAHVTSVSVHRGLVGGRSGADVLEISVGSKGRGMRRQVAKLMEYEEAVKEWTAFEKLKAEIDTTFCVPITAVSRGVHDRRGREKPFSVVVYQHVNDWNHAPGELMSLEQVVGDALQGARTPEECQQALDQVLSSLRSKLYSGAQSVHGRLAGVNKQLGDDLFLSVDKVEGSGQSLRLVHANPGPDEEFRQPSSSDVLRTSASPPGPARSLRPGETVDITLEKISVEELFVTGQYRGATVQVELTGLSAQPHARTELRPGTTIDVVGNVTGSRAEKWSEHLARHFADADDFLEDVEHQTLRYEGTTVGHPLSRLYSLLESPSTARVRSLVHGDLNPRNILLSGGIPYLIDFANFQQESFTLEDISWLELCMLRDVLAPHLSWTAAVRLQRALGVLTRLRPCWETKSLDAGAASLATSMFVDEPALQTCLMVLWRVRSGIWAALPEPCREEWPRHYFEHLVLSACRTYKWDSLEAPRRVRVSVAAAGVASELLGEGCIFQRWESQDRDAVAWMLLDSGCDDEATAWLLTDASVSTHDTELRSEIRKRLSGRLRGVRQTLNAGYSRTPDSEDDSEYDAYIALEARPLAPGERYVQQGGGALTAHARDAIDLLGEHRATVLLSEPGGGKSRVAREFRIRQSAQEPVDALLPLYTTAVDIMKFQEQAPDRTVARFLLQLADAGEWLTPEWLGNLISLGAVHLTVDGLHVVSEQDQRRILRWIKRLHAQRPELRILVCQRVGDYRPDVLRWPAVVLHKVRENAARAYAQGVLKERRRHEWKEQLTRLEKHLFTETSAAALRDLAGKPEFLRLLVKSFVETGEFPVSLSALVRTYLDQLLGNANVPEQEAADDLRLRGLGVLAEQFGAAGSLSRAHALRALLEGETFTALEAETQLAMLLKTSVVVESSRRITFRNPSLQSFCTAIALQRYGDEDLGHVRDSVLQHGWREAAVLLVADSYSRDRTIREVVEAGVKANPWYGAILLQAAPAQCTLSIREDFLRDQHKVLRSHRSGAFAWRRSAYALARYGVMAAADILVSVASDTESASPAAQAALDGLVMMHRWSVPGATQSLSGVVTGLLDPDGSGHEPRPDAEVVERALRSVQLAGLGGLAGLVWNHIGPDRPWPVHSQAWKTLLELQVIPDRARQAAYAQECRAQLTALDRELRNTADTETAEALNEDRMRVLQELGNLGDGETLLAYRFRAGLAERSPWGEMFQKAVATQRASGLPTTPMAAVLTDDALAAAGIGTEQWKRLLVVGDENLATLAAHYILAARDVVQLDLLRKVATMGTPRALSIVAAFVHALPPEGHRGLDELLSPFLISMDAATVESVASFVGAAESLSQETGRRLAVHVQQALAVQGMDQEALHWPWCITWRKALPLRAEIHLFLKEHTQSTPLPDEEPAPALLTLLGSVDVLLDAPYAKPVVLQSEERKRLSALRPAEVKGVAAHKFVLLAASAGLTEELRFVGQVARDEYNVGTVIRHAHGRHGLVEVALAAHAVTATGYLGMLAARDDPDLDIETMTSPLEQLGRKTGDMHPSMERARLIALGYFGQLAPLLGALSAQEDPILADAVGNIVNHWLPGPRTSSGADAYFVNVARTLSEELHSKQLPHRTRALLTELRTGIEDRLGRYVV